MKNRLPMTAAAAVAALLTGCQLQFTQCVPMPGDAMVDQDNMPYVVQAQKTYEERKNFRCDVELRPAESVNVFLSGNSFRQYSVSVKRDLVLGLENKLAGMLSGMRDFNLVGRADAVMDNTGAAVTVGSVAPKNRYLMTYAVTMLDFEEQYTAFHAADDTIGIINQARGRSARTPQRAKQYCGKAGVEVSLYDPSGRQVFTFNATGQSGRMSTQREFSLLKEAADRAAAAALTQYTVQTAPPLYVIKTVGNGSFAQVSGGSAYGITPGRRIYFYRNVTRRRASLTGTGAQPHTDEIPAGAGIVGLGGAPVGTDTAWVYVGDFREQEKQSMRSVFEGTSAKLTY